MVGRAANMVSHADVVVVDWHLERGSSVKAKEIVAEILRGDVARKGRLRLIALYTAKPGLPDLAKELQAHLNRPSLILNIADAAELEAPGIRIIFLQKPGGGSEKPIGSVAEEDIPARLVQEFAKLNIGILPTIALQSIAALREGSHHILATFHSGLDAALVLHRCLLPDPEDAEAFAVSLISAELGSLLEARNVGGIHGNIDVQKDWVAAQSARKGFLGGGDPEISVADVHLWLELGKNAKVIPGQPGRRTSMYLRRHCTEGLKRPESGASSSRASPA